MSRAPITESWANAQGERFQILGWPKEGAKATILVHHGLGEHAGRYDTLVSAFAKLPVSVFSYDCRGHGASVGKRGDAGGLGALADDLQAILPVIYKMAGQKPIILYGHSMGAATVAWYATTRLVQKPVVAIVISAIPAVVNLDGIAKVKLASARVIHRFAPRLTIGSELDPEGISSDPGEVARYLEDPMVHDRLSMRLAISLVDDAPKVVARAKQIKLPTLVLHGEQDPIAAERGGREFFTHLGAEDRELEVFEGLRHELIHEVPLGRQHVFDVLTLWLERQVAAL